MNFLNKFLKLKLIFIISLVICCYSLKSFSLSNDEFYKINKFIEQENVELAFQYLKKNNFLKFKISQSQSHEVFVSLRGNPKTIQSNNHYKDFGIMDKIYEKQSIDSWRTIKRGC